MTSRGRGVSISDWDPMRDEFNDTTYNAQYPDDDTSEGVQLDYKKLYITKLPAALSQEGFVDLFSKYGRVVHSFFSNQPLKKYAFVSFETTGEARIAMMKLHKTEPFNMNICFAHNKNPARTQQSQPNMDRSHSNNERSMNRHSNMERHSHNTNTQDAISASSKGRVSRNVEEHANGNDDGEDTEGSDVGHDPKLGYDLEKIKLQRLQIMDQQLQVQQRMLIHQQRMKTNILPVTKRRLLPDGRSIQVTQDNETSFTAGGGDSRNIPGLQREPSRQCVVCGASAGLYCAGCRVTPYCSERCQRRDWEPRHRAVCHNLARSNAEDEDKLTATNVAPEIPAIAPLRRPHSPSVKPRDPLNDSGPDRNKKFSLPAEKGNQQSQQQASVVPNSNRNQQQMGQNRNQPVNNVRSGNLNQYKEGQRNPGVNVRTSNQSQPDEAQNRNQNGNDGQGRQPQRQPTKPEPKPAEPTVETRPKPPLLKETEIAVAKIASLDSLGDQTPRKPLVPTSFVVEKLTVGTTFVSEVVALAGDCGSKQAGYVCLTLHEDYSDAYDSLCDEFKGLCEKDSEEYTPRVGETFAYFCNDGFWYRARCLARTRAALIDAGRVVSFSPSSSRRLPAGFATIPEFMAVFKAKDLTIGGNLTCEVLNAASGIRVSLGDDSGKTVEVDATRWSPDLEYPEPQRPVPQTQQKQPVTRKPLVPANFVVEKLAENTSFVAEVIALAADCGSKQAGYVCLTLHEDYSSVYDSLCDEFKAQCEKDSEHYTPSIGETFAYFCEDDGFWYRARCLARTRAALIDAGRVVSFSPATSRRLPAKFATIPEFMAVFKVNSLMIGDHLSCQLVSATSDAIRVSIDEGSGKSVAADATRWQPDIQYESEPADAVSISPKPAAIIPTTSKPAAIVPNAIKPAAIVPNAMKPAAIVPDATNPATVPKPNVPEVPRPSIERNSVYVLLDVTSLHRACIRPSDPRLAAMFDSVLHDTLLYAVTAPTPSPLKEPPHKGQTVVAKFIEDGIHYRAFVKRVNVTMNKYLIEYIEYGNEEIVPLDRLYPCPPKLQIEARPTQASLIKLSNREPAALTPAAIKYINNLKENAVELILTIPGGAKTARSGSIASLVVAKSCEPASKQIEELCTPEWKRVAERGGDVLELESCLYHELGYVTLPTSRPFIFRVTFCDLDTLAAGAVSGHEKGDKAAEYVLTDLSKQIKEYCESSLCREPYLPKIEELCVTKHARTGVWVRAVVVELTAGAGWARVLLVDSGELQRATVRDLRRLPTELAAPKAIAPHADITDFPAHVNRSQLERAMRLMAIDGAGAGELRVNSCRLVDENMYEISAPELIAALNAE